MDHKIENIWSTMVWYKLWVIKRVWYIKQAFTQLINIRWTLVSLGKLRAPRRTFTSLAWAQASKYKIKHYIQIVKICPLISICNITRPKHQQTRFYFVEILNEIYDKETHLSQTALSISYENVIFCLKCKQLLIILPLFGSFCLLIHLLSYIPMIPWEMVFIYNK